MAWLPLAEAAEALGLPSYVVDTRGRRGRIPRRKVDGRFVYEVFCPGGDASLEDEDATDSPVEDATPDADDYVPTVEEAGLLEELTADEEAGQALEGYYDRAGYTYDADRDLYLVPVSTKIHDRGLLRLPGAWFRRLWRAYVEGATIAEVSRDFEIEEGLFRHLKDRVRLTRGRSPHTDEEIATKDVDELVWSHLQRKDRVARLRADRARLAALEADADRWASVAASVVAIARAEVPAAPRVALEELRPPEGGFSVLWGETDRHVGKRAYGTDSRGLDAALEELEDARVRLLEKTLSAFGPPDEWIVFGGSDGSHIDNKALATTAGTPQGGQSTGSATQILSAEFVASATLCELLARTAPVRVVWVPGNHDWLASYLVCVALAQRFRLDDRISVDLDELPRKVLACGRVPLLMTHGKERDLEALRGYLTAHAPQGTDVRLSLVVHGDKHTAARVSYLSRQAHLGVERVSLPSPSPADDWHTDSLYVDGVRGMTALRIDHEEGLDGEVRVRLLESPERSRWSTGAALRF